MCHQSLFGLKRGDHGPPLIEQHVPVIFNLYNDRQADAGPDGQMGLRPAQVLSPNCDLLTFCELQSPESWHPSHAPFKP